MTFSTTNPIQRPVILSRADGEGSLTISSPASAEGEMIRDSSTPLRSAQNDKDANRAFAHFRW
jgi:hypothetical protein